MSLWLEELRGGLMELSVLNLLQRGEFHSYEIFQMLKKIEFLSVSDSKVYPLLVELFKEEKIRLRMQHDGAGIKRCYFSLTALGHKRVKEMNDVWERLETEINRVIKENNGEEK